jgi:hypothetical protein
LFVLPAINLQQKSVAYEDAFYLMFRSCDWPDDDITKVEICSIAATKYYHVWGETSFSNVPISLSAYPFPFGYGLLVFFAPWPVSTFSGSPRQFTPDKQPLISNKCGSSENKTWKGTKVFIFTSLFRNEV